MLCHLHIKNFAIIHHLALDLRSEMTVITGETGAGKSIIIDALSVALGDRADSSLVRHGADSGEIQVTFDIAPIPVARSWLAEHDLLSDNECIIRRIINAEGRSRHTINGHSVTLQQLKTLGKLLVHIHGQHQHQALLEKDEQRAVLDNFAAHHDLLLSLRQLHRQWQAVQQQIDALQGLDAAPLARIELLQYQITELQELALSPGEVEQLYQQQRQLTHAEELARGSEQALALLSDDPQLSAISRLHGAQQAIAHQRQLHPALNTAADLVQQAIIHSQEAGYELQRFLDKIVIDPQALEGVERRLDKINQLARKHRLKPEDLLEHEKLLSQELASLLNRDQELDKLQGQADELFQQYQHQALILRNNRQEAAAKINQAVSQLLQQLGLKGSYLQIHCQPLPNSQPLPHGLDDIEFNVSTNVGLPPQPLAKIASGGELSRISLAIQVITAQKEATPTLIFDEVDVGIGGGTAQVVGQLLQQLGQTAQVLCITHLPQVAAQGNHHLKIAKQTVNGQTVSDLTFLSRPQRVDEIARMLGGVKMTPQTLAHAEEMLELSGEQPL